MVSTYPLRLSLLRPPLSSTFATRPVKLTEANVVDDAVRAAGLQGDPTAPAGSTWIGPAVTNLCSDPDNVGNTAVANGGATVTKDTTAGKTLFNGSSARAVCAGSLGDEGVVFFGTAGTVTPASIYSDAGWVYHENGSPLNFVCKCAWRKSDGTGISDTVGATVSVPSGVKTWIRTPNGTAPALSDRINTKIVKVDVSAATFWAGGAMPEAGAINNPYTPTSRGAGRVQVPVAGLFTPTQGWWALRTRWGSAATSFGLAQWYDDSDSGLDFQSDSNQLLALRREVTNSQATSASVTAVGTNATSLFAWTATQVKASANGTAFTAVANALIPTLVATMMDIGAVPAYLALGKGYFDVYWFACGSGVLSNADAITINNFGNTKPQLRQLPGHATLLWDGRTGIAQRRVGA